MNRIRALASGRPDVPARPGGGAAPGGRRRRARRGPGADVLVAAVMRVASAARAGAAPAAAWADLGVRCVDDVPVARDLEALGGAPPTVAAIRAAAGVTARSGAPPAAVLESLAAALEREAELDVRRRAALAGPSASARLLGWLPVVGLLLGAAVGADPFAVLLDGGAGSALLAAGAGAAVVGRAWTARLVSAASAAGRDDGGPERAARLPTGRRLAALRGSGQGAVEVPVAAALELVAAACAAGATVPGALEVVGAATRGRRGAALVEAAALLRLGASWSEAWAGAPGALRPLADALAPAWRAGAGPVGLLHVAARERQREQTAAATQAAGRLGVRLLVPLALCHLPAFVLVGLVPVLVSLARGALSGAV